MARYEIENIVVGAEGIYASYWSRPTTRALLGGGSARETMYRAGHFFPLRSKGGRTLLRLIQDHANAVLITSVGACAFSVATPPDTPGIHVVQSMLRED
jgi:hypothetical protein